MESKTQELRQQQKERGFHLVNEMKQDCNLIDYYLTDTFIYLNYSKKIDYFISKGKTTKETYDLLRKKIKCSALYTDK